MSDDEIELRRGGRIAFVLMQAEDDAKIGEVFRKARIGDATSYAWRKRPKTLPRALPQR